MLAQTRNWRVTRWQGRGDGCPALCDSPYQDLDSCGSECGIQLKHVILMQSERVVTGGNSNGYAGTVGHPANIFVIDSQTCVHLCSGGIGRADEREEDPQGLTRSEDSVDK